METLLVALQVVVGLGIYNVWLVRFGWSTRFRGGEARSLSEEFAVYGLPRWFMYLAGTLKLLSATALLAGIWYPTLTGPAAAVMAVMMAGAVLMHFRVGDALVKAAPAAAMLVMSVVLAALAPPVL